MKLGTLMTMQQQTASDNKNLYVPKTCLWRVLWQWKLVYWFTMIRVHVNNNKQPNGESSYNETCALMKGDK